jgi:hypothetical protein
MRCAVTHGGVLSACVRAYVRVRVPAYVTERQSLDTPKFVVRRQCQSCGLPAAQRRDGS